MSAIADVTQGTIHAVIELEASPARVYAALTTPSELAAWWGSDDTYRTHDWVLDLRPGGLWSCLATSVDGQRKSRVEGEYRVIDPPRVLEHTWRPSWEPGLDTVVRYELEATALGTRVRVVHTGFGAAADACRSHTEGWTRVLGWLTRGLGT